MWTSNISRKCRFHRIWNSCEVVSSITESVRGPFMRQKASSKALIQQRPNQAIVELFKANDQESRSNWILCKICLLNSCSMLSCMKAEYPHTKKNPDAIRSWLVLILRSYFFTRFLIIKAEKLCGIYLVFWVWQESLNLSRQTILENVADLVCPVHGITPNEPGAYSCINSLIYFINISPIVHYFQYLLHQTFFIAPDFMTVYRK